MTNKESINREDFFNKATALLSLLSLAYLAMAKIPYWRMEKIIKKRQALTKEIKKSQNYLCGDCGTKCVLEIHHRVPKSKGGNGNRRNLIGLGTSIKNGGCGCHDRWNKEALS